MHKLPLVYCLAFVALPMAAAGQDIARRPFEQQGLNAFTAGDNQACADVFSRAASAYPEEPSPAFMAARCQARLENTDLAKKYLGQALDRGYRNCAALAGESAFNEFTTLRARCEQNAEAFIRTSNSELIAAYLADRADRAQRIDDVAAVMRRDESRRHLVRISLEHRWMRTADDYMHAALIMQHGSGSADFDLARNLARKAVALRPWLAEARFLYAAATDRYLQSIGKPQIFGTQYRSVDGVWTLEPFDPTSVTDEERAKWRVQSLTERRRFIDDLNREAKSSQ